MVNQLHSRLRLLRTKLGLTQAQLAKILLLPRVTYTHYELGKRTPDLDTIIQMARYFWCYCGLSGGEFRFESFACN